MTPTCTGINETGPSTSANGNLVGASQRMQRTDGEALAPSQGSHLIVGASPLSL